MDEYIPKKDVLALLRDMRGLARDDVIWDAIMKVQNCPPADVRPVVICRECKYSKQVDDFELWCYGFCNPARLVTPDDFCSHGVNRKDG